MFNLPPTPPQAVDEMSLWAIVEESPGINRMLAIHEFFENKCGVVTGRAAKIARLLYHLRFHGNPPNYI